MIHENCQIGFINYRSEVKHRHGKDIVYVHIQNVHFFNFSKNNKPRSYYCIFVVISMFHNFNFFFTH